MGLVQALGFIGSVLFLVGVALAIKSTKAVMQVRPARFAPGLCLLAIGLLAWAACLFMLDGPNSVRVFVSGLLGLLCSILACMCWLIERGMPDQRQLRVSQRPVRPRTSDDVSTTELSRDDIRRIARTPVADWRPTPALYRVKPFGRFPLGFRLMQHFGWRKRVNAR